MREFQLTTPDPSSPEPASGVGAAFPVHIGYLLRSDDAMWSSRFSDGARVDLRGALTLHFMFKDLGHGAAGLRIESLEFDARGFDEYVPRAVVANLERVLATVTADASAAQVALKAAAAAAAAASTTTVDDESSIATAKEEDSEPLNGTRRRSSKTQARGMNTRRRSAATKAELEADESSVRTSDGSPAASTRDPKGPTAAAVAAAAATAVEVKDQNGDSIEARRDRVAPSPVGSFGVTEMGMRCLEVGCGATWPVRACHPSELTSHHPCRLLNRSRSCRI